MSFSANIPKETPQSLWSSLSDKNSRMLFTIPFGSKEKEMKGFVSITGEGEELPLLTICVQNVKKEKCTVTSIVFPGTKMYQDFVEKLFVDAKTNFNDNFEDS